MAARYLTKGSEVYLEGQIETRKYQDRDGADRYVTEIVLRPFRGELVLVGGRGDGSGDEDREPRGGTRGGGAAGGGWGGDAGRRAAPDEDAIPF